MRFSAGLVWVVVGLLAGCAGRVTVRDVALGFHHDVAALRPAPATSHILTPPAPGMPPRYTGTWTAPFLTAAAAAGEGTPAAQRAPAPVSTLASPPTTPTSSSPG